MGLGPKHPPMKISGQSAWRALWISLLSVTPHALAEATADATSTPRVGTEPWVIRDHFVQAYPSIGKVVQYVYFYQAEKKPSLTPGTLKQANDYPVPRLNEPWRIGREEADKLGDYLKKFNEWTVVAEKNQVQELHKELGPVSPSQVVYFHREKDLGSSKSWLVIAHSFSGAPKYIYKLSAADVSALAELLEKLPALDAQVMPKPKNPTDALFK